MDADKLDTEDYFIAYLDILGYKENVLKEEKNSDNAFLNTIIECIEASEYFVNNSKKINEKAEIKMKIFTDNFFYCTKRDYLALLNIISILQALFIHKNIFIRGALYYGKLYCDNNIIYGKGIMDAYEIESEIAVFPRVIIDDTFFHGALGIELGKYPNDATLEKIMNVLKTHYCIDFDYSKFIDYIGNIKLTLDSIPPGIINFEFDKLLSDHAKYIKENLKTNNRRKKQKYQWCAIYHNDICVKYKYNDLKINLE